jgi:hypothetical protein
VLPIKVRLTVDGVDGATFSSVRLTAELVEPHPSDLSCTSHAAHYM